LSLSGLDYSGLVQAFGPARIEPDESPPEWVECLIQTVRALPEDPPSSFAGEDPTMAATRVLFDAAVQLLDWDALRVQYPFFDPLILVSLTRQLATRILLACGSTLELENTTTQTDPTWDFSRGAWMQRLCGFTGLNFVIGTAIRQWKQNAVEILTRAGQDFPVLQMTLFKGRPPGSLVAVEGDLGDRHNDGRSVTVLTFASGRRVVYKPKDLRCALQFLDLLAFLNAATRSVTLPTRQIICRGSYAWEEYVEEREARTEAEAASFFRRFGMLLRVLQLVEGRDFWIDNLRICGDLPVFIDLECILHPRLRTSGVHSSIMGLEPELYEESVLPTAAVTHPIDIPGYGKQDFGGLSSPGPRLLPLGAWSGYRDRRNGNIWLKGGRLYWEPQLAWPQSRGKPADPVDYLDDLEGGYRETQRLLCRCAPGLLSPASPLTGIGDVPVRVLLRSTWEYLVLLRASLEPMALLDGNARELALANVLATAPRWTSDDDAKRRLAIGHSELNAIRILDIPEFYSLPSSTSVIDTSHSVVPDVFEGCARDRLRMRLTEVGAFDIQAHVRILRTAVNSITRGGVGGRSPD
jgi:lantibiotic modifying enzyme